MAGVTGLEPAASGVTGRRSNQTELHPRIRDAVMYSTTPRVSSGGGVGRAAFLPRRRLELLAVSIIFRTFVFGLVADLVRRSSFAA